MAAALPWVKFDDSESSDVFAANCFPVRGLTHQTDDGGGAWLVSQRAEQRRRFKAVLCAKPRTYSRIKEERKKAEREGTQLNLAVQSLAGDDEEEEESPVLDGFFLMKHCCVEDPSDLCSVNIAGQEISEVKEEDLALFDNVAYVNAAENYLPFEAFRGFPILRELEIPINGLRNIKLQTGDYSYMEMVDVSYNNLSQNDVLTLGTLPNLKVLHLTGNNFRTLPSDLALPHVDRESKTRIFRYSKLEILMLDDNRLSDVSVFAALAGLKRLRHLNLEKNEIYYVPQLKSLEGTMIINDEEKSTRRRQKSARNSARKSASSHKSDASGKATKTAEEVKDKQELKETDAKEEDKKTESIKEVNPADSTDLTNLDFGADFGDLSKAIADLDLSEIEEEKTPPGDKSQNASDKKEQPGDLASNMPPFPELTYLNLAHNQIAEEDALLAVAAWPMLVELVIHNNPLTTDRSGDPPLLKRFLTERLGIKLIRKTEKLKNKPHVIIPPKRKRKVSSIVPKIPKLSVEELLMLEAPPAVGDQSRMIEGLDLHQEPLPPIAASKPDEGIPPSPVYNKLFDSEPGKKVPSPPSYERMHSPQVPQLLDRKIPSTPTYGRLHSEEDKKDKIPQPPVYGRIHSAEKKQKDSVIPEPSGYSRQFSPPENGPTIPEPSGYSRQFSPSEKEPTIPEASGYSRQFSPPEIEPTIPEASGYSRQFSPPEKEPTIPEASGYSRQFSSEYGKKKDDSAAFFMTQVDDQEAEEKLETVTKSKKDRKKKKKEKEIPEKYKGYEILLDVEDDPDLIIPKDIHGNIKALKYALSHELVYRDSTAHLHSVGKPVPPYKKWQMPAQGPLQTRQEKVDAVLDHLKKRSTVEEANLAKVLKGGKKYKKFDDAQVLLQDIQSRYNAVRVNSMKEAKEVKKAMQDLHALANGKPISTK